MIRAVVIAFALLAVAGAALGRPGESSPQPALARTSGGLLHANSRDGQAVLAAANLRPGESRSGEVTIRNSGGAGAIALATRAEGPLAGRLRLRVTDAGSVVLDTSLAAAPECVAAGSLGPGDARTYRFTVTFVRGPDDGAYMGASARADFEWLPSCGGPGTPAGDIAPIAGALTLGDTRLAVGRGPYRFSGRAGTAKVKVRCLEAGSGVCAGRLELERRERGRGRGIAMAVGTFRIPAGKTRTITLKLNPRARRRIKSSRAVPVRAYVTATDAQGRRHRAAYRDTLRYYPR